MKVTIWTDGATRYPERGCGTSSIILTNGNFLGLVASPIPKIRDIEYVELYAIIQGLRHLRDRFSHKKIKKVMVLTDRRVLMEVYELLSTQKDPMTSLDYIEDLRHKALWKQLFELKGEWRLEIFHTKGHRHDLNPNSIADIYAKLMCRAIDKDEPTGLHKGFVTPPKEMKRKCNHTQSTTPCGDKDKS